MRVFLCNSWNMKKLLHTVFPKFMNHNKNNTRFINWDTFNLSIPSMVTAMEIFRYFRPKITNVSCLSLTLHIKTMCTLTFLEPLYLLIPSHSTGSWLKSSIKDKGAKFDVLYSWKMIFIFIIKFWNRKEKMAIKLVLNTFGNNQSYTHKVL